MRKSPFDCADGYVWNRPVSGTGRERCLDGYDAWPPRRTMLQWGGAIVRVNAYPACRPCGSLSVDGDIGIMSASQRLPNVIAEEARVALTHDALENKTK